MQINPAKENIIHHVLKDFKETVDNSAKRG